MASFNYENGAPPNECQQSLSYDLEESRFYVIQDQAELNNLTELDKVKLKKSKLIRHFEICTNTNGEVTTEITVLNPDEVFEDWMTKTVKTVVDKDKITMYNEADDVVFQRERGDTSKAFYNVIQSTVDDHGLGFAPPFHPPPSIHRGPNNFTVFTADDETLPDIAENARLHYQSKVAEWESNLNDISVCWLCFYPPVLVQTIVGGSIISTAVNQNEAEEIYEAYQVGLDWLNWQANDSYKVVIGAKTFDNPVVTGGECWCTYTSSLPYPTSYSYFEPVPNSDACSALTNYSNTFCSWEDIITYLPKEFASDGVVLAESAVGLPSATAPPQRMADNNHMEMRNSPKTMDLLNGLFNTGYGDNYFKTLPRD